MKKYIISLLCAVVMFTTAPSAMAEDSSVDTSHRGSITLHYIDGETSFPNLEIHAYRVATVNSDDSFSLVAPFSTYPINTNNIHSQTEWRNIANTLASYIIADNIAPTCAVKTDNSGTVFMNNMETGLYLILATKAEKNGTVYSFENFFVVLPTPTDSGLDYDIEAIPKKEKYTGHLEYKVIKLWQDKADTSSRPQEITVDIFRNGVYVETQLLNAENDWTYYWTDSDGTGTWTVVEKDVPDGYTVTVTHRENIFDIVNRLDTKPDDFNPPYVPDTGDITNARTYLTLMCASGLGLIIIGIYINRKK